VRSNEAREWRGRSGKKRHPASWQLSPPSRHAHEPARALGGRGLAPGLEGRGGGIGGVGGHLGRRERALRKDGARRPGNDIKGLLGLDPGAVDVVGGLQGRAGLLEGHGGWVGVASSGGNEEEGSADGEKGERAPPPILIGIPKQYLSLLRHRAYPPHLPPLRPSFVTAATLGARVPVPPRGPLAPVSPSRKKRCFAPSSFAPPAPPRRPRPRAAPPAGPTRPLRR
jgi:hypothetical protein